MLAYGRCLNYPFVYDDMPGIQGDSTVNHAETIRQAFRALFEPSRPLTRLSYALTHALFGFSRTAFHTTNILIHIINTLLVFGIAVLIAKRWLPAADPAWFGFAAATIHAVHPLYTEAVTYVSGRSSSLCALFYFACLFFVLCGLNSRRSIQRGCWFFAAGVSGLLAFAAKEEAITLPIIVAVLLILAGYREVAIPLMALPAAAVAVRWRDFAALYNSSAENRTLASVGLGTHVNAATYAWSEIKAAVFYYQAHFVMPLTQSVDPDFRPVQSLLDPAFLIAAGVLALLVFTAFRFRSKDPVLAFSIAALLVSPLLAYALIPLPDIVAEHRVYISGLGFDLLVAWLLVRAERFAWACIVVLAVALTAVTVARNSVWKSEIALWQQASQNAPDKLRPHLNLGATLQGDGRLDRAILEYKRALAIQPDLPLVYSNLATMYLEESQIDEAEPLLKRAVELAPTMPQPYINLAAIAVQRNEPAEAFDYLSSAEKNGARQYWVHFLKAEAFVLSKQPDSARKEYQIAETLSETQAQKDAVARRKANTVGN